VIERFVAIEHVTDTSALSIKAAIDWLFSRHGLRISKLQGQGYDKASNMRVNVIGLSAKRHGLNQETSLQRKKDQDIVNAMNLVKISKERLQTMRDDRWDSCLSQVSSFCVKHRVKAVNMEDMFIPQ
ncbi:hypothetical protein Ddye_029471, partial [Dipteronia dyeriana]